MFRFRSGLALALALLACPALFADPPIRITDVRVGLPAGRHVVSDEGRAAFVVKNNTWAPVYVWFELGKELRKDAAIVIETTDSDDLANRTAVPLQNLAAELPGTRFSPAELRFMPYVRPSGHNDVTVTIRVPEAGISPERWAPLSDPFRVRNVSTRDTSRYVVLSLGSTLPGFTLPKEAEAEETDTARHPLRGGRIETAAITNVAEMPDQWYGYESADIVILSTNDEKFIDKLFSDPAHKPRLDALLEWVRRGGRLAVSAGRNASLMAQYPKLQEILPATIKPDTAQVAKLSITWQFAKTASRIGLLTGVNSAPFPVANLEPKADRGVRTLVPAETMKTSYDRPAVLQSAFGLGRVTLVAFDLDNSPFRDASFRPEFWDTLLREAGADKASTGGPPGTIHNNSRYYMADTEDEITTGLLNYVDQFEGVPVISFGWVALFILLYTLLIGPVEYYILKKVFHRLELTWITFPIIVLSVSAIAYFTAYAIKGKDLKMNKVDLIDIDPASNRIYGRFWLTVFSPRVETFRIGLEPNPGWADGPNESPTTGSFVNWFGGTRTARQSLFRRSYYYHLDPPGGASRNPYDEGLVDVPIPVWSTKAFSAEWSASLNQAAPLVISNLIHPPADPAKVTGSFTLNLPIGDLKDAYILYAGKAFKRLNPIRSGDAVTLFLDDKDEDKAWLVNFGTFSSASSIASNAAVRNRNYNSEQQFYRLSMGEVLFHERSLETSEIAVPRNSSLRRLDQSQRISDRNRDEIIVLARLTPANGLAEEILAAKDSPSPTRLWLKELPGEGQPRTPIPGTLRQDTFVRIYIPIKR